MRIALLSAGASLVRFDEAAPYDLRIGVNTAAKRHRCDWWSAGDHPTYLNVPAIGRETIRVFMLEPEIGHLASVGVVLGERALPWSALRPLCPVAGWDEFSAPAALVLAVHLGATSIDCYGCDMRGTLDYEGRADVGGRIAIRDEGCAKLGQDGRWPRERRTWNHLIDWLDSLGVAVRRLGHASPRVEADCEGKEQAHVA